MWQKNSRINSGKRRFKRCSKKNIRMVAGKPLIAWTIGAGLESRYIDRLILSSEDAEIIEVAHKYGCEVPFIRPPYLAEDTTPGIDVLFHAIASLTEHYDYVVYLQPTSPLRLSEDIDGCIEECLLKKAVACVSVTLPNPSPYWMYYRDTESGQLTPVIKTDVDYKRRQDLPQTYALNGAVYVADLNWLERTRNFLTVDTIGYIMPPERSFDVDSELDLEIADIMLRRRNN